MKKISDIKGDYGTYLIEKLNEKIKEITKHLIVKLSDDNNPFIEFYQEFTSYKDVKLACNNGINMYYHGSSRTLSFVNSCGDCNIVDNSWSQWVDELKYEESYSDDYMTCILEYCVKKTDPYKIKEYKYTIVSNIKYLKLNFKAIAQDFGEPISRPTYFDAYGAAINENDEIVWTQLSNVKLNHNIVKQIKDNILTFDNGVGIRIIPNEKHSNIFVIGTSVKKFAGIAFNL